MIQEFIGTSGLVLLALSWIPQVKHIIKTKNTINMKFGFAQFTGSSLLTIYAIMIWEPLFIILNAMVAALVSINIGYSLKGGRK